MRLDGFAQCYVFQNKMLGIFTNYATLLKILNKSSLIDKECKLNKWLTAQISLTKSIIPKDSKCEAKRHSTACPMAGQKQKLCTVTNALAYYTPSKRLPCSKGLQRLPQKLDMNAVFPMVILLTVNTEHGILFEQESSVRLTSFTMPVN